MNYPRVNLLNKSEQRYQGAVSRRFLLVSLVVTPIVVIAMLSGVKLIQYTTVQSDLKSSREIWAELEPRLALYLDEQRGLNTNRQVFELIDGWKAAKFSPTAVLEEIQQRMPENIQLVRLSIKSKEQVAFAESSDDVVLTFRLLLQGLSHGDYAEEVVIALNKDLQAAPVLSSTFESITLLSMPKRAGKNGENIREFNIEGLASEGERP
jgi:hypothetical protein